MSTRNATATPPALGHGGDDSPERGKTNGHPLLTTSSSVDLELENAKRGSINSQDNFREREQW